MTCHNCRTECRKHGKDRRGIQRYKCQQCSKTFLAPRNDVMDGMYTKLDEAERILALMVEGMSVRSIERITGTHRDTVLKVLVLAGQRCERILGQRVSNVPVKDIQADEIWGFVGKKQKALQPGDDPNFGDAYTFVAIERNTKLVLNFALGKRDQFTTNAFIEGLRLATSRQHFQVTADGFPAYPISIETTLSDRVDFAQLIKVYRATPEGERRYSPAEVVSTETVPVVGNPDPKRVCTSHVERQNLTMRMQIRRLTRLTNAFSKKWENLWAMLCLYFAWYNFCRIHRTLRVTPAMEAGIADHVWSVRELIAL